MIEGYAVILGAGASHGALLSGPTPPLDTDFLAVACQVLSGRGRRGPGAQAWNKFTQALRAAGLKQADVINGRLEHLSTYLEARANMPAIQSSAGRPADYTKALSALLRVICFTLSKTGGTRRCPLHQALFELVKPRCVITFNYDLIADQTLFAMKRLSWFAHSYCGSAISVVSKAGQRCRRNRPTRRLRRAIRLLKLHGSIHWQAHHKGSGFNLWLDRMPNKTFTYTSPPDHPLVVPPVAAKMTIQRGALRNRWSEAARQLRDAPGWLIWGYSFPKTDTVTQLLCRVSLTNNRRPKPVIVINPDPAVADNVRTSLNRVSVRRYLSVERFLLDHHALKIVPQNK